VVVWEGFANLRTPGGHHKRLNRLLPVDHLKTWKNRKGQKTAGQRFKNNRGFSIRLGSGSSGLSPGMSHPVEKPLVYFRS